MYILWSFEFLVSRIFTNYVSIIKDMHVCRYSVLLYSRKWVFKLKMVRARWITHEYWILSGVLKTIKLDDTWRNKTCSLPASNQACRLFVLPKDPARLLTCPYAGLELNRAVNLLQTHWILKCNHICKRVTYNRIIDSRYFTTQVYF